MDVALGVAVVAARAAGAVIREGLACDRRQLQITEKTSSNDLVTRFDLAAEREILPRLRDAFPDHGILSEEAGESAGQNELEWWIDPLDGTTNFAHGHPQCAVSITCALRGEPIVGAVYDPAREELFTVTRESEALLNGEPIRVSTTDRLEISLLATGFAYDRRERSGAYVPLFEAFMRRSQGVRRMGAAALDLAWLACGRYDGFWESGLNPWDIGAGGLLIERAGGRLSRYDGGALDSSAPARIVASNGAIHDEMLAVIKTER